MSANASSVKSELKVHQETGEIQKGSTLGEVVKTALQTDHPLLKIALKQEQTFRERTEKELGELLTDIKKRMAEKDLSQVKKAALEKLELDLELVNRLNTLVESFNPKDTQPKDYTQSDKTTCTYPLKFNKMALAIPGAKTLINEHFEDIFCKGILPKGYGYHSKPSDITMLGKNPDSIYGDSKGTFLKTAALTVHLSCTGTVKLQDIKLKAEQPWIDNTAMAHVTHIPRAIDLEKLDARFEHFSYLFHDDAIPQGMIFVHSGYSFGGQRDTAHRYKMGSKAFGPEDCSSWISKLSGSTIQFSTLDQIYAYRLSILKSFNLNLGTVPAEYASTRTAVTMNTLFDPVLVKDPQKDIRPGQIYAHRSYDLDKDPKMEGPGTKGGHTGIVLDFISSGKESGIAVLAYGRNMPHEEGFGVQQFPFSPENRKVMLFSLKSQNLNSGNTNEIESQVLGMDSIAKEKIKI